MARIFTGIPKIYSYGKQSESCWSTERSYSNQQWSYNRLRKSFERIEEISRGGHIAIQYKFSDKRDYKVQFTDKEGRMVENWKVIEKKLNGDSDGEIQFEYGERFNNFRKIITKKRWGTVANKSYESCRHGWYSFDYFGVPARLIA